MFRLRADPFTSSFPRLSTAERLVKREPILIWRLALCVGRSGLVKRMVRLPPTQSLFCSHRKVTKRCVPRACRPRGEAARVRKYWPGSAEGTSCAAAEDAQSIARPASGVSVQYLPTGTGGWITTNSIRRAASDNAATLRAVDLPTVSGRRGGGEKARRVARRDSGQFAVSTRKCCQRTPELARVVVRLLRTTDPPRAHLWPTFLCEEKGGAAGGSPAKRLTSMATAKHQSARGSRKKRLANLAKAEHETARGRREKRLTRLAIAKQKRASGSRTISPGQVRGRLAIANHERARSRREKRLASLARAKKREAKEQGASECAQ